jgi:hypothetical protein
LAQVLEGLQKGFLNRVLGIFSVMRDVVGDSEKFAIVSLYELFESSYIPILAGMDKIQVIVCRRPRCELCRVCSHIRSRRFGEQQDCGSN